MSPSNFRPENYTVGWVGALPVELAAASEMLDEEHPELPHDPNDNNIYTLGRIGQHNVVIACLPAGQFGTTSAATVAVQMKAKFPAIRFGLMVGVGGGVPSSADIRLGDVVVSQPSAEHGGVVQYDSGTATASGFKRKGFLNAPPPILLNALNKLRANHLRHRSKVSEHLFAFNHLFLFRRWHAGADRLFTPTYNHTGGLTCDSCDEDHLVMRTPRESEDVEIHYGTIASGNQVIRNGITRDQLSAELGNVLCFEMEAAGLMNGFPCIVIRGICDYADTHKNKRWQPYAAAVAAAYAKDLLSVIPAADVMEASTVQSAIGLSGNEQPVHVNRTGGVPEARKRDQEFNINNIGKLSQVAYTLYSTLRGGGGVVPSTTVQELCDVLFGLHCSLNHLSKYIVRPAGNAESQTSNVFKRPDVLILRCGDILEELRSSLDKDGHPEPKTYPEPPSQWISNQSQVAQAKPEIEWCLSSIDILLDGLLRPDQSSPTKVDVDSNTSFIPGVHRKSGPPQRLAPRMQLQLPGNSDLQPMPQVSRRRPEPTSPFQPVPAARNDVFAFHTTQSTRTSYPNRSDDQRNLPPASRNRISMPSIPSSTPPPSTDFPSFSQSTPPRIWISHLRLQLEEWESRAVGSPKDKRLRQRYALKALTSLNSHIGSIRDRDSRCRLREQLEHHGLADVIGKMKAVVGNLVVLEKQVEVYCDDKNDDELVS
ncbi:nucleoside phosphorylase domain-containing protein [Aspergillus varians]